MSQALSWSACAFRAAGSDRCLPLESFRRRSTVQTNKQMAVDGETISCQQLKRRKIWGRTVSHQMLKLGGVTGLMRALADMGICEGLDFPSMHAWSHLPSK